MYELLEAIDDSVETSQLAVNIAICESYVKAMNIIDECGPDSLTIFQESVFLYQESGDETLGKKIKRIVSTVISTIKKVIDKIINVITKKINKSDKLFVTLINVLNIADAVQQTSRNKIIKEYAIEYNDDEYIQESTHNEAQQSLKERKKAVKKAVKERNKTLNKFVNVLYKDAAHDVQTKILSKEDIKKIVMDIARKSTNEEFTRLQESIINFRRNPDEVLIDVAKNYMLIDESMRMVGELKRLEQMLGSNGKNTKKGEDEVARLDMKADFQINKLAMKNGYDKMDAELNLIKNFADTVGKSLNKLSRTDDFTFENLKRDLYAHGNGIGRTASVIATLGSVLFEMRKRIPEAIKGLRDTKIMISDIQSVASDLYDSTHDFDDYIEAEGEYRKDLGIKMNYLVGTGIKEITINNIKEETYGWADDAAFNAMSYGNGDNLVTLAGGGPFTLMARGIIALITKDPSAIMADPNEIGIADVAMKTMARTIAPNGGRSKEKREYTELDHGDQIEYALPADKKYPIHTSLQLKTAVKLWKEVPFFKRSQFARCCLLRAHHLGVPTDGPEWKPLKEKYDVPVRFDQSISEENISKLKFALPDQNKYPINTKTQLLSAVDIFPSIDKKDRKEFAKNCLFKALYLKMNIDDAKFTTLRKFYKIPDSMIKSRNFKEEES